MDSKTLFENKGFETETTVILPFFTVTKEKGDLIHRIQCIKFISERVIDCHDKRMTYSMMMMSMCLIIYEFNSTFLDQFVTSIAIITKDGEIMTKKIQV